MDPAKSSRLTAILLATLLVISATLVNGQISTPCTLSMISSFTPCFNFITGSIGNGSSSSPPTTGCCGSLQTIMSTSVDCACLLITANVPVQLPINRTLALSLPRACNLPGVPALCKASGSPLPSPGSLGPAPAPAAIAASPFSPRASKAVLAEAPAPESETTAQLTPASPPVETEAPATNPGMKPAVLNPSASAASYVYPAPLLLLVVGVAIFKSY